MQRGASASSTCSEPEQAATHGREGTRYRGRRSVPRPPPCRVSASVAVAARRLSAGPTRAGGSSCQRETPRATTSQLVLRSAPRGRTGAGIPSNPSRPRPSSAAAQHRHGTVPRLHASKFPPFPPKIQGKTGGESGVLPISPGNGGNRREHISPISPGGEMGDYVDDGPVRAIRHRPGWDRLESMKCTNEYQGPQSIPPSLCFFSRIYP